MGALAFQSLEDESVLICRSGSLLGLTKYVPLYLVKTGNIHSDLCYKPNYVLSMDDQWIVLLLEDVFETKIYTGVGQLSYKHSGWVKVLYNNEIYWLDARHISNSRIMILFEHEQETNQR